MSDSEHVITVLLVDDIPETREGVKTLLSFERDLKVVGMASNGREGLMLARELMPDVILMDINMPDIDGLQVTTQIINYAPRTRVIIMSAQDDPRYVRQAMLAGAKAFLNKPPSSDELYNTIRAVYKQIPPQKAILSGSNHSPDSDAVNENRAGHIIVVYSPQGGAGCTTIATNLASGLMRDSVKVLLVDANLQFGDVGVYLNLQPVTTLVDLVEGIEDIDTDYFENALVTHSSGLKVLMGPTRLELAEKVSTNPEALAAILRKIRWSYDFIIVDTSLHLDEMTLSLLDLATQILLVSTPTLSSTKNVRTVMDLFSQLNYPPQKIMLILNKVLEERTMKKYAISSQKITDFLKQPVLISIPLDDIAMFEAVQRGIPVIVSHTDHRKSPVQEFISLSSLIFTTLMPEYVEKKPDNGHSTPRTRWKRLM
jgi:pilus assembly protein CpaE